MQADGRSLDDKRQPLLSEEKLGVTPAQALTEACQKTLGSKPESVDVLFFDIPRHDWATGGVPWSERQ